MCHDKSFIDFSNFNTALIVGKIENNDLFSNGVGKTSIFKAIEYLLFNQADVNLEKIIRDDTNYCRITMDFLIDTQEYRISRTRTKKGSTDLSLHVRTPSPGTDEDVYHQVTPGASYDTYTALSSLNSNYWTPLSGSRASDTEKELSKLIKINFKAFRSTIHFIQNDFTGLTTATPEKRKTILKDALNLVIYSKLEELAKEQGKLLSKKIDKEKILLENLGDPNKELISLNNQLSAVEKQLLDKNDELGLLNSKLATTNDLLKQAESQVVTQEEKSRDFTSKEKNISNEVNQLTESIKDYSKKKSNLIKQANELIKEVTSLKEEQLKLASLDFSQIDILTHDLENRKEKITQNNVNIRNYLSILEELSIPMPDDNLCKHCRQEMSPEHKKNCQEKINTEILACKNNISSLKEDNKNLNINIVQLQTQINSLSLSKKQLETININISNKTKEISDKKSLFNDYDGFLSKYNQDLVGKQNQLAELREQLKLLTSEDDQKNEKQIVSLKQQVKEITNNLRVINNDIHTCNANKAVTLHNIEQKTKDQVKVLELKENISSLEKTYSIYPYVIQGFSSTGIPNLIIQNVLDDLQTEANNLLNQLKPGLQLSFVVGKTKDDGTDVDTLDILYQVNGKERYYEQLSGAMKLATTFSLKLGLSFLLQQIIGTNIQFLMLDEIDQSLDKASVDAFADIVKFFQKDFTILIITHNDRLKDKFSHAILVEQDINMVSRARVVSSW